MDVICRSSVFVGVTIRKAVKRCSVHPGPVGGAATLPQKNTPKKRMEKRSWRETNTRRIVIICTTNVVVSAAGTCRVWEGWRCDVIGSAKMDVLGCKHRHVFTLGPS